MGELFQGGFPAQRGGGVRAFLKVYDLDRLMRTGIFRTVSALMCTDPCKHIVGPAAVERVISAVQQIDEASFLIVRH